MFWSLLGIVFLAALAMLLVPLKRWTTSAGETPQRPSRNSDVYKAQLIELEADVQDGRMNVAEASAARLEIERRLLKSAEEAGESTTERPASFGLLAMMSALILLAAAAFYLSTGRVGMPDFPLKDQKHSVAAQATENPDALKLTAEASALELALDQSPDDIAGWRRLGQLHSRLQNRAAAAQAFQKWQELAPDDATAAVVFGESLIMLSDGRVSPAARLVLEKAQALQPQNPGVRHYLALADYQAGDVAQALTAWKALEAQSAEGAPWLGQLRAWIVRAEGDLGIVSDRQDAAAPALRPEDRDAIAAMSKDEQLEMIQSMVGRLQAKMDANPENIEGWFRLAKAYMVLGQKADAAHALEQALPHADPEVQEEIKKQLEILRK